MRLQVLGSGSAGNGYILDNGKETLVIEAGVPFMHVLQAIGHDNQRIVACIVSHKHGDHYGKVKEYKDAFVNVVDQHEEGILKKLGGNFWYVPVKVKHDVECYAFYIYHSEMGYLLFATDCSHIDYSFAKLDHILIEANYEQKIMEVNYRTGVIGKARRDRTILNHMSLQTCIEYLKNYESYKEVVLLHLSDKNANSKQFASRVRQETGKPTYVARRGFTINLYK